MLRYANTGVTTTVMKREPRCGALYGAKMSHSQPNQAPSWLLLPRGAAVCTPLPPLLLLEGQGPVGEGEASLSPGPAPELPPARLSHHCLQVTAICAWLALRGHRLELCLKNSSAQERWKS